jgi:hypothetical protein
MIGKTCVAMIKNFNCIPISNCIPTSNCIPSFPPQLYKSALEVLLQLFQSEKIRAKFSRQGIKRVMFVLLSTFPEFPTPVAGKRAKLFELLGKLYGGDGSVQGNTTSGSGAGNTILTPGGSVQQATNYPGLYEETIKEFFLADKAASVLNNTSGSLPLNPTTEQLFLQRMLILAKCFLQLKGGQKFKLFLQSAALAWPRLVVRFFSEKSMSNDMRRAIEMSGININSAVISSSSGVNAGNSAGNNNSGGSGTSGGWSLQQLQSLAPIYREELENWRSMDGKNDGDFSTFEDMLIWSSNNGSARNSTISTVNAWDVVNVD